MSVVLLCVQTHVGLCFCVNVDECIRCWSCWYTVVASVSVCTHMCFFPCTELPKCHDTDVRKRRHSVSDKQTMPGGGFKQCAAIALLLSVCPRCRVTEVFSAIKVFSMLQHCVCVCVYVCSGRGSPATGYIGHAQTKLNTQQEPQAIRACHSA